jgi:hypothetical protein
VGDVLGHVEGALADAFAPRYGNRDLANTRLEQRLEARIHEPHDERRETVATADSGAELAGERSDVRGFAEARRIVLLEGQERAERTRALRIDAWR